MADLTSVVASMAEFLIIVAVGYGVTKAGIIDEHTSGRLIDLIVNVGTPAMVVAAVCDLDTSSVVALVPLAALLAVVQFFAMLGCGWLYVTLARIRGDERRNYLFMSCVSNSVFLGLPIVTAIFGGSSVVLVSVFSTVTGLFVYSVGFALVRGDDEGEASLPRRLAGALRSAVNPPAVASVVAIALVVAQVHPPEVVSGTLEMLGNITSPVAMLVVGHLATRMRLSDVFREWRLYPFIVVRELVAPVLVYLVLSRVVASELLVGVFVVMYAMPVAAMAPSYMEMAGGDYLLTTKGTLLTTLGSFVVIPVLVWFMTAL